MLLLSEEKGKEKGEVMFEGSKRELRQESVVMIK